MGTGVTVQVRLDADRGDASAAIYAARQWKFDPAPKDSTEVIEFEFKNPAS
jgi:hypothetical protein